MESKRLRLNNVQFDYFSENFRQFEIDFYKYSKMNIPLTFIVDDIVYSMSESQSNYFKLPGIKAKDQRNHYFFFEVFTARDNRQLRTYQYVGHSWVNKQSIW